MLYNVNSELKTTHKEEMALFACCPEPEGGCSAGIAKGPVRKAISVKREVLGYGMIMLSAANHQLLSKQGDTVLQLSSLLMRFKKDDRLPSSAQLSQTLGVGAGTLQAALKYLENNEAVELNARGQLGTTVRRIDYVKLLELSGSPWIFGAMPLPYSPLFEGLATGLYQEFGSHNIPLKISYLRGGKVRVKLLIQKQVDFVVCSRYTAEEAIRECPELEMVCSFGERSYVSKCGIIFRDPQHNTIQDNMRLGVDNDSYDHVLLNHMLSDKHNITFVSVCYSQLDKLMRSGEIDASFWSFDDRKDFSGFNIVPFGDLESNDMVKAAQEAVLLVRSDSEKRMILSTTLDQNKISEVQRKVVGKEMLPSY